MRLGLNTSMSQSMRMDQRMILSPQIIQSIEILQLPIMALQERIDQELLENPALEIEEGAEEEQNSESSEEESTTESQEEPSEESEEVDADIDTEEPPTAKVDESAAVADEDQPEEKSEEEAFLEERLEKLGDDWSEYFSGLSGGRVSSDEEDSKLAAMQNTAASPESLQEHLIHQLALLDLEDDVREHCESIIYSLDGNGYLLYPLDEIFNPNGEALSESVMGAIGETVVGDALLEPGGVSPVEAVIDGVGKSVFTPENEELMSKVAQALNIVQSLEPTGVGCRDIQECLLLQIPPGRENDLPRTLIQNHLEDLEQNRLPKIAKETGCSIEDIKDAIAFVQQELTPRPGSEFSIAENHYVIPDILIEYVDDKYEIRLEDGYVPRLLISPTYARMLKDANCDAATKDFVLKKIQSARWLIEAIEQRRSTVYKIANEIVTQQRDFFDKGIAYLHPLKMQEVAERTGVHVSTVSRAISGKYLQTDRGIYAMKYFFTGGLDSDDGGQVSTKSVKQSLVEIIEKEDKKNPLSDEEIVARLKEKGMNISRRTVTKYRKQLRIPSSRQRREY